MNKQDYLKKYIEICNDNLKGNSRILSLLKNLGIYESYLFENFSIGYSAGSIIDIIGNNEELKAFFTEVGIIKNNKEEFSNYLTIPVYNENKAIVNIAFFNPHPQCKNKLQFLNNDGIFNSSFLKNNKEVIITISPIETLLLIQANYPNTTFLTGDDSKYVKYFIEKNINNTIFTFEGKKNCFTN
jgi:hypothetical protein